MPSRRIGTGLFLVVALVCVVVWWTPADHLESESIAVGRGNTGRREARPVPSRPVRSEEGVPGGPEADGVAVCVQPPIASPGLMHMCARELARAGCPSPIPVEGHTDPESHRTRLAGILDRCDGVSPADLVIDCSSFPCLVALRRTRTAAYAACVGATLPEPLEPDANGWSVFGLDPIPESDVVLQAEANRVLEMRLAGLRAALDSGTLQGTSCTPRGPAVDCDEVIDRLGCVAEENPDWQRLVEAHFNGVDRWLDEMSRECEPFDSVPWTIDCTEIPCAIAVSGAVLDEEGLNPFDFTCATKPYGMIQKRRWGEGDWVTVLPLTQLVDCEACDVSRSQDELWQLWQERGNWRAWQLHRAVPP